MVGLSFLLAVGSEAAAVMRQGPRPGGTDTLLLRPRAVRATRTEGRAPRIDGRLEEDVWRSAVAEEVATDFVQQTPAPGSLATLRTEARVAFDDEAIYVAVRAFDPKPEGILAPYPRRDDEANCDWLFVEFDSRHDHRTAFSFGVNPRGVQVDGTFSNDVVYDPAWNAVWQAAAGRDSLGWTAEFRIPFSQLPYTGEAADGVDPEGPRASTWGLNVYRYSPQHGEVSNWSPRLPTLAGVVSRFNELRGLEVPSRVRRLEARPFAALDAGRPAGAPVLHLSGGADLRLGLGSALALTAAVRPDFGQVEADPSEINLSTFETFFAERRPFFVEGASAFRGDIGLPFSTRGDDFGSEAAFYSRRVGGAPRGAAVDGAGDILAAIKLSGRTASGWTIGALTAFTTETSAQVRDSTGAGRTVQTSPAAAYSAIRAVRDFGGGTGALGTFVTFVGRLAPGAEASGLLPRWALAAGLDGRDRFAGDTYEVSGFVLGSTIWGEPAAITRVLSGPGHYLQRSDATPLDSTVARVSGLAAQARIARVGGAIQWSLTAHAVSPAFEINDVGFQRNADWLLAVATIRYRHDRPGPVFLRWAVGSDQIGLGWSFAGERRAATVNAVAEFDLRNYWGGAISVDREFAALSVEALRGGPALLMPPRTAARATLYSDQRRATQLTLTAQAFTEPGTASFQYGLSPELSARVTDRLSLGAGASSDRLVNGWQYVARGSAGGRDRFVLARLDQTTLAVTGRADYAFSPNLTLQLYLQPFLGAGRFDGFKEVAEPRARDAAGRVTALAADRVTYDPTTRRYAFDLDGDGRADASAETPDFSRQSLRGSAVLRWEFRPGSELYLVWTQSRDGDWPEGDLRPRRDVRRLFAAPPQNVVLMKVSYRWAP